MFDLEKIIEFDKQLLLMLNGSESLFWDGVMSVYTTTVVWIPFALALVYLLIKNNSIMNFVVLLLMIALVITLTDGITSTICKPLFARFRPTHDPDIMYMVDVVNNYRAYKYGFMSSHAANSFGVAVFVMLLVKHKLLSISVTVWAMINCYSRIYLGVHYPGDILCGAIIGGVIGTVIYIIYSIVQKRIEFTSSRITANYTRSGYLVDDVRIMIAAIYATFLFICIYAPIYINNNIL